MFGGRTDSQQQQQQQKDAASRSLHNKNDTDHDDDNMWVTVSWMPHSSLSQTSHVTMAIRSIHADDALLVDNNHDIASIPTTRSSINNHNHNSDEPWRVQVSIHGMAGQPLVPMSFCAWTHPKTAVQDTYDGTHSSSSSSSSTLIHLPIRWRDLPRDAYVQVTAVRNMAGSLDDDGNDNTHRQIHDNDNQNNHYQQQPQLVFCTSLALWDAFGRLRTGLQRLPMTRSTSADTTRSSNDDSPRGATTTTTANLGLSSKHDFMGRDSWDDPDPVWKASRILYALERMETTTTTTTTTSEVEQDGVVLPPRPVAPQRCLFGQIPSVPWLDQMTKERCHQILLEDKARREENAATAVFFHDSGGDEPAAYLILELPEFELPILHEETRYPTPQSGASGSITPLEVALRRQKVRQQKNVDSADQEIVELVPFLDYEDDMDNPVEDKYRTLAHDLLRGLVDPALKPDREQRDRLASIIASPSQHPTREERDLLWRFRFSLVDNRRALTKFLLAVDWTVESEVVQAAELLEQWRRRSPIEVTDALKLLGKHVAFQTSLVRDYAIDTLAAAPDAELRLYLLQLVQAIKYETAGDHFAPGGGGSPAGTDSKKQGLSSLANFLIDRAAKNIELANYFYWYLKVELHDPANGMRYRSILAALKNRLSRTPFSDLISGSSKNGDDTGLAASVKEPKGSFLSIVDSVSKLGSSLRHGELYSDSGDSVPQKSSKQTTSVWDVLLAQDRFVSGIMNIQMKSRDARGKRDAKEVHLKELLSAEGYDRLRGNRPVPLPSAPYIMVNGVNPQSAKVFKSALYPALIEFHVDSSIHHDEFAEDDSAGEHSSENDRTKPPSTYKVIVKTGDDLRQDQLVIMMIQLMDGLLKRGTLDLCLRPYSIISMSPSSGLVEFVDGSIPISQVLANYNNSIMHFFRACSPKKGTKYDVRQDVISTYVRSCAGYCVITYILGVGDRHLDNIMLQPTGHFFHIDFGFIFGRDPKPLPPAFRLTREMVEGMGGVDSTEYRQFCSLACQAFNTLRKSAGLILNLLHLMSDAGIEDLSNNPTSDAEGVISRVEERLRLDLTDEQAETFFLGLINDSLAALAPRVMDVFHSLAVARR